VSTAPGEPATAWRMSRSGSVEAEAPAHLVLVHDRVGVAAGDAGVVRQPVGTLLAAEERWASFKPMEPLSEVATGYDRNARDETTVQIR
jgi:hypothetical protein